MTAARHPRVQRITSLLLGAQDPRLHQISQTKLLGPEAGTSTTTHMWAPAQTPLQTALLARAAWAGPAEGHSQNLPRGLWSLEGQPSVGRVTPKQGRRMPAQMAAQREPGPKSGSSGYQGKGQGSSRPGSGTFTICGGPHHMSHISGLLPYHPFPATTLGAPRNQHWTLLIMGWEHWTQ